MENTVNVSRRTVNLWLDMAEMMLSCGAEIYRIEDTLMRIGKAYGTTRMEVFAITSHIVVTAEGPDWEYTCTRRLRAPSGSDFTRLEDLNSLARAMCRKPYTDDELQSALDRVNGETPSALKIYAASFLAAFAFALFFGGSLWDAGFAGLFGLVVCWMSGVGAAHSLNRFSLYFFISVCTGVLICLISKLIPVLKPDKIIVGVIMLTIPGIPTTNSIRDMLTGDTLSGTMRLIQSLMEALVLAGSYMFAVWLTDSSVVYQGVTDGLYQLLPATLGALAYAMLFNCRTKYSLIALPGGLICWGVYLVCELCLGMDVFASTLVSALICSILAEVCARAFRAPATLFLIPFIVPLIPGSSLFYSFSTLIGQTSSVFGMNCIKAVLGIAVGTGIVASLFTARLRAKRK